MNPAEVLCRPLTINKLTLANRMVMGPMAVLQPLFDGRPSDQTIAFFVERAKGGVGLIIVGGSIGTTRGYEERTFPLMRLDREDFLPDLQKLADAIHAHGTPIFGQINTGFGRMGAATKDRQPISASPLNVVIKAEHLPRGMVVPGGIATPMPRAATIAEIREVEDQTVEAASRLQRAGFDGMEILAHVSYFVASFLSSRTNWRTDEYGGSEENRARILVNIVRRIRERTGPDFPIGVRITSNEHVEGSQTPEQYAAVVRIVEREGLDYLAIVDGAYERMDMGVPLKDGDMIEHGEPQVFKRALSIPLLLGNLHDPRNAAAAIADGHCDAVMLARPLLADPHYANKVRQGRLAQIVMCDRSHECLRRMLLKMPIRCSVNAGMGRESRLPGALPPLRRWVEAPLEHVVLKMAGSSTLSRLAAKLLMRVR